MSAFFTGTSLFMQLPNKWVNEAHEKPNGVSALGACVCTVL